MEQQLAPIKRAPKAAAGCWFELSNWIAFASAKKASQRVGGREKRGRKDKERQRKKKKKRGFFPLLAAAAAVDSRASIVLLSCANDQTATTVCCCQSVKLIDKTREVRWLERATRKKTEREKCVFFLLLVVVVVVCAYKLSCCNQLASANLLRVCARRRRQPLFVWAFFLSSLSRHERALACHQQPTLAASAKSLEAKSTHTHKKAPTFGEIIICRSWCIYRAFCHQKFAFDDEKGSKKKSSLLIVREKSLLLQKMSNFFLAFFSTIFFLCKLLLSYIGDTNAAND